MLNACCLLGAVGHLIQFVVLFYRTVTLYWEMKNMERPGPRPVNSLKVKKRNQQSSELLQWPKQQRQREWK